MVSHIVQQWLPFFDIAKDRRTNIKMQDVLNVASTIPLLIVVLAWGLWPLILLYAIWGWLSGRGLFGRSRMLSLARDGLELGRQTKAGWLRFASTPAGQSTVRTARRAAPYLAAFAIAAVWLHGHPINMSNEDAFVAEMAIFLTIVVSSIGAVAIRFGFMAGVLALGFWIVACLGLSFWYLVTITNGIGR